MSAQTAKMPDLIYRYRIKLSKLKELKFISHLDWQSLILKTFRRMGLKLALSQGFNPTPKISFSPALPLFIESECEFVGFETLEPLGADFEEKFIQNISDNVKLLDLKVLPTGVVGGGSNGVKKPQAFETLLQWAQYEANIPNISIAKIENLKYNIENCLLSDNLFIKKINKKGFEKNIDYKNSLKEIKFNESDKKIIFTLKVGQSLDADALQPLRADDFIKKVFGNDILFEIKRTKFFDTDLKEI